MDSALQNRHHYTVYGLHVIANQRLSEVLPAPSLSPDTNPVYITFVEDIESLPIKQPVDRYSWYTHPYKDKNDVPALQVWLDGEAFYLAYHNNSRYVVDKGGNKVWAVWSKENDFGFVTAQIIGPILGLVLQLQGLLVLHASVLAWNGQALAILGTSGTGKSTTAAELSRLGCQILSDDIAALIKKDDTWLVQPGYPRLRLWPQTAEALYGPQHKLRPIVPGLERWDKRYLEFESRPTSFITSPQPLKAVYVLDWSKKENAQITIAPLTGVEALTNLDANSFMVYLLDQDQRQQQMTALVSLLDQVSIYQVQPVADLATLPDLGTAVLKSFKEIT